MLDSFKTRATLAIGSTRYTYHDLTQLEPAFRVSRLPYSYKILLENLLRLPPRLRQHLDRRAAAE